MYSYNNIHWLLYIWWVIICDHFVLHIIFVVHIQFQGCIKHFSISYWHCMEIFAISTAWLFFQTAEGLSCLSGVKFANVWPLLMFTSLWPRLNIKSSSVFNFFSHKIHIVNIRYEKGISMHQNVFVMTFATLFLPLMYVVWTFLQKLLLLVLGIPECLFYLLI